MAFRVEHAQSWRSGGSQLRRCSRPRSCVSVCGQPATCLWSTSSNIRSTSTNTVNSCSRCPCSKSQAPTTWLCGGRYRCFRCKEHLRCGTTSRRCLGLGTSTRSRAESRSRVSAATRPQLARAPFGTNCSVKCLPWDNSRVKSRAFARSSRASTGVASRPTRAQLLADNLSPCLGEEEEDEEEDDFLFIGRLGHVNTKVKRAAIC